MTEPTDAPPAPHPAVETALVGGRAVLFDDRSAQIHELNASASAVWMLIDGQLRVDQIVAELGRLLGVAEGVLATDVTNALADFARRGLLAGSGASAASGDPG